MATWQVLVEAWQIECCGTPPTIGAVVDWQLAWSEPVALGEPAINQQEFSVATPWFPTFGAKDPTGTVLRSGAVTAWWDNAVPPVPRINLRGYLREEHHDGVPEQLPFTHGVVQRVEVLTVTYARHAPGSRSWSPIAGTGRLEPVRTSPKWFAFDDTVAASGAMSRDMQTGVIVTIEVSE